MNVEFKSSPPEQLWTAFIRRFEDAQLATIANGVRSELASPTTSPTFDWMPRFESRSTTYGPTCQDHSAGLDHISRDNTRTIADDIMAISTKEEVESFRRQLESLPCTSFDTAFLWNRLSMRCEQLEYMELALQYAMESYRHRPWDRLRAKIDRLERRSTIELSDDEQSIIADIEATPTQEAFDRIERIAKTNPTGGARLYEFLAEASSPLSNAHRADMMLRSIELEPLHYKFSKMARLLRACGNILKAEEFATLDLSTRDLNTISTGELVSFARLRHKAKLLSEVRHQFPYPIDPITLGQRISDSSHPYQSASREGASGTAYFLHNSFPYSSGGYAVRTHNIVKAMKDVGWTFYPWTRYGFPQYNKAYWHGSVPPAPRFHEVVDGVDYHFVPSSNIRSASLPLDSYQELCAEAYAIAIASHRPATVQAASNWQHGIAAATAARSMSLPFVYEVRGLWELTRRSREPEWARTEEYQLASRMEFHCANIADHVITITSALKQEMVDRGVDGGKITVIPNAVDPVSFSPRPREVRLVNELPQDSFVLGFVGTLMSYEGLDDLIRALAMVNRDSCRNVHLLIVGDGPEYEPLGSLANEVGVASQITFAGRVPYSDVPRYWSLADLAVFPRKPLPVTEMVSPIKVYEVMAMEKPVLVSNVAAMAEMVIDSQTGFVFPKGSIDELARTIARIVEFEQGDLDEIGRQAREWVVANRTWNGMASKIRVVHENVLQ